MFKFMKEFRVVTVIDYRGYNEDKEIVKELNDYFTDVAKHFRIAYSDYKRHVIDIPPEVLTRDNVVAFGTGKKLQLSWRCVTTPNNFKRFHDEVNDYVLDKKYALFTVYDAP